MTPEEAIWEPGPWEHRDVSANGARFHTVTTGSGPPVILLHGYPMFWWTWRHLLPELATAGYTAIAVDMRGYGGSDHTPHGYDLTTLASDLAGIIRAHGFGSATVVGHGWGGLVAWSAAVQRSNAVRAIAPVAVPHPILLRRAQLHDPEQRRLSRYAIGYQWPFTPERALLRKDAAQVEELLRRWSGTPGWPDPRTALHYRRAMQFRSTAHCALEYYRWALRSIPRSDGRRYLNSMKAPVVQPVLHILGRADGSILPRVSDGSEDFVTGRYERIDLAGVGHFPHEEDAMRFRQALIPWLDAVHS
ncbi:MAG: alpha/beta hydrolase [Actinobacteria bacterium]|nr:alpha/beta hydrolase [Actinomycetota bacterium]